MSRASDPTMRYLSMVTVFFLGAAGISGMAELWKDGMIFGAICVGLLTFGLCNTLLYYGFKR